MKKYVAHTNRYYTDMKESARPRLKTSESEKVVTL